MTDRYSSDEPSQLPADDPRVGYTGSGQGGKATVTPLEGEIPQDEQDGKLIYDLEKASHGHGADVDRFLEADAAKRLRVILGEEDSIYLPDGKRTTDTPPAEEPPPDPPVS